MAGIGFELQKVLRGGGVTNFLKVAMSGIVIVAGPWIISMAGIFFLNRFASFALTEGSALFMAAIVYSYAFSLSLFGGIHYVFIRYISDLIFDHFEGKAVTSLLYVMAFFALVSGVPAAFAVWRIEVDFVSNLNLYRTSAVLLFITINLIWLVMLFITLLKKYMTILVVFIGGMAVSFFSVYFLGGIWGLGGALLGFTLGQLFILIYLSGLVVYSFRPVQNKGQLKALASYFIKYRYLFLAGLFYSLGIWMDKFSLWILEGTPVLGTWIHLFEQYDIAVYFANLTIIPGMVYFTIFSETDFYSVLRKFLLTLEKSILTKITEEKYKLIRTMNKSFYEQSFFQGVITISLIIIAPALRSGFLENFGEIWTIRLVLGAVFFHLFFLTALTFLFYIEMYKEAFWASFIFATINGGATILFSLFRFPYYGAGYLIGSVTASLFAFVILRRGIKNIDRRVYGRL